MIDGNTAALNQHQREIDDASEAELALEKAKKEFSRDLFDAYFEENYAVIGEVNTLAAEEDAINNLLKKLRDAYPRPSGITCAYRDFIAAVCDEIAGRVDDVVSVGIHRRDYGL